MENQWKNKEIKWRTKSKYVDIDTAEELTLQEVKQNYTIINKKKKSHVYKTTGNTEIINECRRTNQGKLPFD